MLGNSFKILWRGESYKKVGAIFSQPNLLLCQLLLTSGCSRLDMTYSSCHRFNRCTVTRDQHPIPSLHRQIYIYIDLTGVLLQGTITLYLHYTDRYTYTFTTQIDIHIYRFNRCTVTRDHHPIPSLHRQIYIYIDFTGVLLQENNILYLHYTYIYMVKVTNLAVECSMPYKQNVVQSKKDQMDMGCCNSEFHALCDRQTQLSDV